MPYIKTRTNTNITEEQEINIKSKIAEVISIIGKSESWLMVDFDSNCNLYFKGTKETKNAYIEVKLFGGASSEAYNRLTNAITEIISTELGMEKNNIYVSYFETNNWGWNGNNF